SGPFENMTPAPIDLLKQRPNSRVFIISSHIFEYKRPPGAEVVGRGPPRERPDPGRGHEELVDRGPGDRGVQRPTGLEIHPVDGVVFENPRAAEVADLLNRIAPPRQLFVPVCRADVEIPVETRRHNPVRVAIHAALLPRAVKPRAIDDVKPAD